MAWDDYFELFNGLGFQRIISPQGRVLGQELCRQESLSTIWLAFRRTKAKRGVAKPEIVFRELGLEKGALRERLSFAPSVIFGVSPD